MILQFSFKTQGNLRVTCHPTRHFLCTTTARIYYFNFATFFFLKHRTLQKFFFSNLSPNQIYTILPVVVSTLGVILTIAVVAIYIKHQDTPIAKACSKVKYQRFFCETSLSFFQGRSNQWRINDRVIFFTGIKLICCCGCHNLLLEWIRHVCWTEYCKLCRNQGLPLSRTSLHVQWTADKNLTNCDHFPIDKCVEKTCAWGLHCPFSPIASDVESLVQLLASAEYKRTCSGIDVWQKQTIKENLVSQNREKPYDNRFLLYKFSISVFALKYFEENYVSVETEKAIILQNNYRPKIFQKVLILQNNYHLKIYQFWSNHCMFHKYRWGKYITFLIFVVQ